MAESESPEIDRSVLDRGTGVMGVASMVEVLDAYFCDLQRIMEGLRDGWARGDAPRARLHAHSLKGASAMLGATRLSGLCATAEARVDAGEFEKALLAEIDQGLARATAELRALRDEYCRAFQPDA